MFNPAEYMLHAQKTMMTAAAACARLNTAYCLRTMGEMQRLLAGPPNRRVEDLKRGQPCKKSPNLAKGPQLDDHYGHRAHDVDLEHV